MYTTIMCNILITSFIEFLLGLQQLQQLHLKRNTEDNRRAQPNKNELKPEHVGNGTTPTTAKTYQHWSLAAQSEQKKQTKTKTKSNASSTAHPNVCGSAASLINRNNT